VPFAEAAAIPIGGLTALGFLRKARIAEGKKVLIYGASGSVGTYAVQLAKYFGAHVTGVCSTANLDLVRSLGADSVLDYTADEYYPPAKTYDIVFDAVGKSSILKAARSLKADGYFLNAYHIRPSHILSGIAVALFTNKHVIPDPGEGTADDLSLLGELAQSGTVKPVIDRRYTLDEIVEAHRYVEKGHKKGNVVITM
ncbi:MAG: NAD(P)-dependent alcohol dehydrogenase, partial [Spirochaetota bacterium]